MASRNFKPLPWQIAPWRDKSLILLLTGAAGGGKSRLAAEKVHAYMLKYPGATGIVGRKDRASARRSVVPFLRKTVMAGTEWGEYKKGEMVFDYNNGSQLWVIGVKDDQQREGLRSLGQDGSVDIAWMEEANKLVLDDHNEIIGRMRGKAAPWRQIIYTTNPDRPDHWIKKMLIDGHIADPLVSAYFSKAVDNPYNPEDYISFLKTLTGVYYQRMYLGLWVQAEGAVYTEYDPAVHFITRKEMEKHLPGVTRNIVSIDFGYTNPFSASLWQLDENDTMYLSRQVYSTGKLVEDHAKAIKKMIGGLEIEAWITDHDAEDRATLESKLGIITTAAFKSVLPGIEAVKARLRDKRIFFCGDALVRADPELEKRKLPLCTTEEISGYRWSDKKQDVPVKEHDHGLDDEMRYCVAYVDHIDRESVGSVGVEVGNWVRGKKKQSRDIPF